MGGMAQKNRDDGAYLYRAGDEETRNWFHRQWAIWPERADEALTTNGSLHHGGVQAYRAMHGEDPEMSDEFREYVSVMDRYVTPTSQETDHAE